MFIRADKLLINRNNQAIFSVYSAEKEKVWLCYYYANIKCWKDEVNKFGLVNFTLPFNIFIQFKEIIEAQLLYNCTLICRGNFDKSIIGQDE